MSRFSEIEAFIEVAQRGSFTQAADALMLSRSRVSQLIQQLEARLQQQLLVRTTRRLTLTSEGEQFLQGCRLGMNQLNRAEADLKLAGQRLSGPVRLNSVGGIFGESFLADALATLVTQHPELTIQINYTSALVDFNHDPVDLVLRIGHAPAEGVASAFLGEVHHTLCASPAFVNQHGYPATPDDLERMPTVCGTPKIWELEHRQTGEKNVITPSASWRSGSTHAQLTATRAGLGISRLLTLVAQPDMDAGQLVSVLPAWRIEPVGLWLMWRAHTELPKRIQHVRDHLIDALHQH